MNAAAASNQKTVPLIEIATDLLPSKNRVDTYRTLIAIALKENLKPLAIDTKGLERLTMFIQPIMSAKINLIAEQNKVSYQEAFAGLTAAGMESLKASHRAIAGLAEEVKAPFKALPDQLKFYKVIHAGLQLNKITLAEASTGVGKGMALCAAAIESAEAEKTPVLITAPTLQVLGQLWQEMDKLRNGKDKLGKELSYSFYPGASEFVNEGKLIEFMLDHEDDLDPDVAEWIKNKGSMLNSNNPLKQAMQSMGVSPSYLMEDLRTLAVNFPVDDFILRSGIDCQTTEVLKEIRAQAISADIIFCTHTMLAMSQKLNWALVPEPAVLFVDEAHQFEQAVANVHSDNLSLFSLAARIKRFSKSPSKAVKSIAALSSFLQTLTENGDGLINLVDISGEAKLRAASLLEDVNLSLKSKSHNDVDRIDLTRKVISNTIGSLNGNSRDSAYLSFSPDLRYPSIATGKSDIGSILGSLWKSCEGGAVLASATLYIKNQYGDDKCDYICDILAVPTSRIYLAPPIVAKWVTSMPTLCIPSQTEALLLSRPKLENIAGTDDWLLNLSKRIELIANQAKGGTLVLATSYAQLCAFTTYLSKSSVNQNRLIIQEKYKKVEVNRTLFKQKHAEGIQPVWLALGSAWTGLNLKEDNENIEDTLFTDLVITCCPLNNNRSNTMLARIEARSMNPIIKEALMTLKQGLGRLMRNEKQQGRKIWFLDGRIYHGTWKGMEEMQKSTIKLLLQYKKVIIFNGDSSK